MSMILFSRRVGLYLICLFLVLPAWAQRAESPRILALEEAIDLAQKHSKQLVQDSIQLDISGSRTKQLKQSTWPEFSLNGSYLRISDNITPFKVSFPTGELVLNPQILNQSYNSVQARQLVWAGGKVNAAREAQALETKLLIHEMARNRVLVKYSATSIWYELYTLQRSQGIIESNIQLLREQRRDLQNAVNEGVVLQNELLKLDLAVTSMETSLLELSSLHKTLSFNLCILTGLDPLKQIRVKDELPSVRKDISSATDAVQLAILTRPELKQFEVRYKQAELGKRTSRSNYFPVISAAGQYNFDRPNQRLFPNQAVFTGTWNMGIFLSWSLTGLLTTGEKLRESTMNLSRVSVAKAQALDGIQMEVNGNFNGYSRASQKIRIAEKALEQAAENFRVDQNRFRAGTLGATDFLNANTLLLQANLNLEAARASADLAFQKLLTSINN